MLWKDPRFWFFTLCALDYLIMGVCLWRGAKISDESEFNRVYRETWKQHFEENVAHKWTFFDGVGN